MKPKLYNLLLAAAGALFLLPAAAQTPDNVCSPKGPQLAKVKKVAVVKSLHHLDPLLNTATIAGLTNLAALESLAALKEPTSNQPDEVHDQDTYQKGYTEKVKKITRTFKVGAKDKLSITNEYGRVAVNVWPKNEIKVDLVITAYEANDGKADDLLNNVTIAEASQGHLISFKTNINRDRTAGWWGTRRINGKPEEKRGVEVAYVVYMPTRNALEITNSLGSVFLPDYEGPVNVNVTHGSFKAEKLSNPVSKVKVSYGSADIEEFSSGNISVNYGSLRIENGEKFTAKVHAGSTKIGNIFKSANLNLQMGGCKIDRVDSDTKTLEIIADKSSVSLGIDPASAFNFDVSVTFGGFKYEPEKVALVNQKQDDDGHFRPDKTRTYKGKYGSGSTSAQYTIKSSYGSVKFL